jgi:hypothetical protein
LECISEWLEEAGGMREETAIEVNEAEKALEVLNSLWLRIVRMESTLEERGVMPVAVTWWPRKETEGWAKVHLES